MKGFKQGAQCGAGVEAHGKAMGFAKGGFVKSPHTSPQFKMTTKAQDSMDDGVQPKRRGRNQAEVEAGGQQRVKLKFEEGGRVKAMDNAERKIINDMNAKATSGQASDAEVNKAIEAYRRRHGGARALGNRTARELAAMGEKKGGYIKKARGGKVTAAKRDPADRNRVTGASRNQGAGVKPAGKGSSNMGTGGTLKGSKSSGKMAYAEGGPTKAMAGGYMKGGKSHSSNPMYGKYGK